MARLYTNNYSTTLNGAITNVATTITVTSVTNLPAIGAGATCNLTIDDGTNIEIVTATSVSGFVITVTRGVEGTTGTAFADLTPIELRPTAAGLYDIDAGDQAPTGAWDFGGATSLEIPNGTSVTTNVAGEIGLDTDGDATNVTQGVIQTYDGTQNLYFFGADAYPTVDGTRLEYDSVTNKMIWAAGGGGGNAWSDPVDASIVPDTDSTYTIGTSLLRFSEGHFDTIDIGGGLSIASAYIYGTGVGSGSSYNFSFSGGTPRILGPSTLYSIQTNNDGFTINFGTGNSVRFKDDATVTYAGSLNINMGSISSLEIPNSTSPTVNVDGKIAVDTLVTDFSHGILKYYGGEELGVVAMPIAQFTTPTDGSLVAYNATNDEFELIAKSKIIQQVSSVITTSSFTSTTMPDDDTIPQNTEGGEITTVSITPSSTSNLLYIRAWAPIACDGSESVGLALFQDTTASALAATQATVISASMFPMSLTHIMTAGTVSSTTFKIRAGGSTSAVRWNGKSGARVLGGVMPVTLEVIEIGV